MTTQYFDNPTTGFKQYRGSISGAYCEWGEYTFALVEDTVSIPTYLSKILSATLTPKTAITSVAESLYCTLTVSAMVATVGRVAQTEEYHFALDNGQISAYNYVNVPLMIAPGARTLTEFEFYHGTAFGSGTTICNLGISSDDGKYLEDISVTNAADTTAAGVSTTVFTSGTSAVTDGSVLIFETEDGGGSGPGDGCVSMSADRPLTSALCFNYFFIGLP